MEDSNAMISCSRLVNDADCTSIFQIPAQFIERHGGNLPPKATLRVDQSGKCWEVKVEKFKDQYFFTDGWKDFAKDVNINSWECLVLNSGVCEDGAPDREETPCVEKNWRFTKELHEDDRCRLVLPSEFALGTGIAKVKNVTLKNAKGKEWLVRVGDRCGDITMGSGWNAFLIANKVVVGSTMLFKFLSCSNMTMEAQVVKVGTDGNAVFNSGKRKRVNYEVVASHMTSGGTNEKALSKFVKRKQKKNEAVDSCMTTEYEEEPTNFSLRPTCERKDFGGGKSLSFSKKLNEHHLRMLAIPDEFVIGTGITTDSKIKLKDAEGREWPVRATDKNCGKFSFTAGWYKFLVANNVVVGSTVSFEFIANDTIEARVVIVGTDEKALFSCVKRIGGKYQVSTSHKRIDLSIVTTNSSPNADCVNSKLSFSKKLKKYNLYELDIPLNFARRTEIAKAGAVNLEGGDGRKWTVRVTERKKRVLMSTGWYDFLKENSVVVGSTISFIWSSANVIEIHIVKEGTDRRSQFHIFGRKGELLEITESQERGDHVNVHSEPLRYIKSV